MKAPLAGKKVIVLGLVSAKEPDPNGVLLALGRRLEQLGATVVGHVLQRRGVSRARRGGGAKKMDQPLTASTFIGKGKAAELAAGCVETKATLVVSWNDLSSSQRTRLEALIGIPVENATDLAGSD